MYKVLYTSCKSVVELTVHAAPCMALVYNLISSDSILLFRMKSFKILTAYIVIGVHGLLICLLELIASDDIHPTHFKD